MKPHKSISRRIRFTRTGKLVRRVAGQNHFNAKESRRSQRAKRQLSAVSTSTAREIRAWGQR
jgi:ribosomal protein L35